MMDMKMDRWSMEIPWCFGWREQRIGSAHLGKQ